MLSDEELRQLKEESDKDSKLIKSKMKVELTDLELRHTIMSMSNKLSDIKAEDIKLEDINTLETIYMNVTLRAHTYDLVTKDEKLTKYFDLLWKGLSPLHKAYGITLVFSNLISNNRGFAQYNSLSEKEKEDINDAIKKLSDDAIKQISGSIKEVSSLDNNDNEDEEDEYEDTPLEMEEDYDIPEEDDKPSLGSVFDIFRAAKDKKKNKG